MSSVDISGLNKKELLLRLWEKANIASFFTTSGIPAPAFDHKLAETAVDGYIDYFCGRCIKSDLSGKYANPVWYNRDAGDGQFEKIVNSMRSC